VILSMPRMIVEQHEATRDVVEAIPLSELRWSLLAIGIMDPLNPKQGVFELLDKPRSPCESDFASRLGEDLVGECAVDWTVFELALCRTRDLSYEV